MVSHRVNRLAIELHAADKASGQALFDRVQRLHHERLLPTLDRVCSELSPEDGCARIDEVCVDLGSIAEESFEDDFIDKLEPALRRALAAALRRQVGKESPASRSSLELIEAFALTGSLPWWADTRDGDVVAEHLTRAAVEAPGELLALLRRVGADAGALRRLARSIDDQLLLSLAGLARMGCDRRGLATVANPAMPLPASRRWELLSALATRESLCEDAPRRPDEHTADPSRSRLAREPSLGEPIARIEDGTMAAPEGEQARGPRAGMQHESSASSASSLWLHVGLSEASGGVHLDAAAAEPSPVASQGDDTPGPAVRTADGRPSSDPAPMGHVNPVDRDVALSRGAGSAGGQRPAKNAVADAIRTARRRALGGLGQIYAADAGLVILWPFLERFFGRLGLLSLDRGFVDDEACTRAIALTEALATGEADPLEHRLPLAKVLSGRSPEADFQLDQPLRPEELAEVELLLAAVIDHARVLGDLSIAGFRTAFLLREGMLTTSEGAWLLQVERQAHDVLFDRFPWSWGWVRLPWMPDPVRVEW